MTCLGSPVGGLAFRGLFFGCVPLTDGRLLDEICGSGLRWVTCHDQQNVSVGWLKRGPAGRRVPHPIHHNLDFCLVILMIVVPRVSSDTVQCYRPFCAP